MPRLLPALLLAVAFVGPAAAQREPVLGVERLGPAFDALGPAGGRPGTPRGQEVRVGPRGPVWNKAGQFLLFSDIPKNMVWKWSAAGGLEPFLHPQRLHRGTAKFGGREPGCNGLALDKPPAGSSCASTGTAGSPAWTATRFTTLADKFDGKRFNSPNDLVYHSSGDLYFTDPPYGLPKGMDDPAKELPFQGVYRLKPSGEVTLLTKAMTRPNGIALVAGREDPVRRQLGRGEP